MGAPEAVITAYQGRLEALTVLNDLLEQEFEALHGLQPAALSDVVDKLSDCLERVERAHNTLCATREASGWTAEEEKHVKNLMEQTSTTVEQILRRHSANEALAARSLLLARYCIGLVSGFSGYGPDGALGRGDGGSLRATVYSRRG